jgi:hypothetical protein
MVRGVALPFLIVPAIVWARTEGMRVTVGRCVLAIAGLVVVVLPWTVRNYRVSGAPILLSTDGACACFFAHNPLAEGTDSDALQDLRQREFASIDRLPPPRRDVEHARAELSYGTRYLLAHPWHAVTVDGAPVGAGIDSVVRASPICTSSVSWRPRSPACRARGAGSTRQRPCCRSP